ncbi:hypothetical protein NL108_008406 [Boleophthalmus pectinirostris]|uniref:protein mono-ADP-ribosyltransferase PARP3-like n=1 Tax=Boleophthalmus pectinirostris TaxID=150288 RepID=UPI00243241EC|nr:protein mono-ADP-ribosyltransferase PARP3-like [Boleophthalmus pectinirostris]KAJ0068454.1 hypothetical protein NL108_008406 [Boleophthalmus pectinirostris]
MAPKRRASSSTAAEAGGKRVKREPETPLKPEDGEVYEDYDCLLNLTNIAKNNNKFYVIQVRKEGPDCFHTWTSWGRVGYKGQNISSNFTTVGEAIEKFEKKFKDKIGTNWSDRDNFVSHPGKYTLIDVDGEVKVESMDGSLCTSDKPTQELMELIFSNDMFKKAMEEMNLAPPLDKLSEKQIMKGSKVLKEIEHALNQTSEPSNLEELSSEFYTNIPHDFGNSRPPTIDSKEIIEKKKEMLLVLKDIKLAKRLKLETANAQEVSQPVNQRILTLLDKTSERYKIIENYLKQTKGSDSNPKIINVWEVNQPTEGERFRENHHLENRRLLWHDTNIAVVAAILKNGLRIKPHSGRQGIYFASEYGKCKLHTFNNKGIMFLYEVVLGEEHTITTDNSSLMNPPDGFNSVVARGRVEPDPSQDVFITLDGKKVAVPQGPAIEQSQYQNSSFHNSEYRIYKESQCCIRYLLLLK